MAQRVPWGENILAALSLVAAGRSIGFWMRRQQVSLLVFPSVLIAPRNLEMNVCGTFAVDAFNLMKAFRATHADVSFADIDRLPSTGLIDLGVDVIAHLSRGNSRMTRVHVKCVFRARCSGPTASIRHLGLLDCEMAVVLSNYIIPACSLILATTSCF